MGCKVAGQGGKAGVMGACEAKEEGEIFTGT